ncbi:M56 family metallopeptidase [Butyricicoccus pullicaecorum]|uniref:M56 family metallopeptidase n=1 Tax=Butyricicoccus pullicaecorum TaxID=501571 RepID=UPI0039906886
MTELFLSFVNRSITAGWLILPILCMRWCLRNFRSKDLICILWGLVGLRLALPFSLPTPFSLVPSAQTIPTDIMYASSPAIDTGLSTLNQTVNPMLSASFSPDPSASANPLQIWLALAALIWVIGIALFALYALISLLRMRHRLAEAVPVGENVWVCDHIASPFLLGLMHPRIYLPSSLDPQTAASVIAHEHAHLMRRDPIWKAVGFVLLALYWFHPLVWVAYILFCRDMELACDARATRDFSPAERKTYAEALLACSLPHAVRSFCPLAFGEIGVKSRIRALLQGKKPSRLLVILTACVIVALAVCFLTDPVPSDPSESSTSALALTDDVISDAILTHYNANSTENLLCTESHIPLLTTYRQNDDGSLKVTAYLMVLYLELARDGDWFREQSGSHIPTALTFHVQPDGSCTLTEYWEPDDGSLYAPEVRSRFPEDIAERALDTQRYIDEQMKACYDQAIAYWGLEDR